MQCIAQGNLLPVLEYSNFRINPSNASFDCFIDMVERRCSIESAMAEYYHVPPDLVVYDGEDLQSKYKQRGRAVVLYNM